MIPYQGNLFNFGLLLRIHGSAVYKAILPSILSTVIYLLFFYLLPDGDDLDLMNERVLSHPYSLAVLVSAFTFLLTFRANFGYNRYWEGATAVHQMHSKWLDFGMNAAAYHYQSVRYKDCMPPAYGSYPDLCSVARERERENIISILDMEAELNAAEENNDDGKDGLFAKFFKRKKEKVKRKARTQMKKTNHKSINSTKVEMAAKKIISAPSFRGLVESPQLRQAFSISKLDGGLQGAPSLFLQEAVHLISLLSAVALSTLRVDDETFECPLIPYIPGTPWPPVDPDLMSEDIKREFTQVDSSDFGKNMRFILGTSRTARNRTMYNAARPMRVLGGVSDAEVQMLQSARGPLAKVALCSMWLQEFISREVLAGSTGAVAPPIVSRLYQFCSDGMVGYNQARKVAYVPFPFVHAQISALFIFVLLPVVPLLMLTFVDNVWVAALLNFFTILCFCGLHEVARELENPFSNEPNDLPLVTFQCQFNEALLAMYAGYHPDAWWEVPCFDKGSSHNNPMDTIVES